VNKALESSLVSYHGYKLLTIKISSCLKLSRSNRELRGVVFLKDVINDYNNLLEQSLVIMPYMDDTLVKIDYSANPLLIRRSPTILTPRF